MHTVYLTSLPCGFANKKVSAREGAIDTTFTIQRDMPFGRCRRANRNHKLIYPFLRRDSTRFRLYRHSGTRLLIGKINDIT